MDYQGTMIGFTAPPIRLGQSYVGWEPRHDLTNPAEPMEQFEVWPLKSGKALYHREERFDDSAFYRFIKELGE